MTSMTTPTDDRPVTRAEHPSWCYANDCNVHRLADGTIIGEHEAYRETVKTLYGAPVRIGAAAEHGCEDDTLRVAVNIACDTDQLDADVWPDDGRGEAPLELRTRFGARAWMHPEEARLVARFLLDQADRVEQLRDAARGDDRG